MIIGMLLLQVTPIRFCHVLEKTVSWSYLSCRKTSQSMFSSSFLLDLLSCRKRYSNTGIFLNQFIPRKLIMPLKRQFLLGGIENEKA